MIFEALARSLARYFRRPATQVSSEIFIPEQPKTVLWSQVGDATSWSPQASTGSHDFGVWRETRGVRPPEDAAVNGWMWSDWKREMDLLRQPGWALCRFANRSGPAQQSVAAFVFGIVRGSFGIYQMERIVRFTDEQGAVHDTEHLLSFATHIDSGLGVGIFAERDVAITALELADRVCDEWQYCDPNNPGAYQTVVQKTCRIWEEVGIGVLKNTLVGDDEAKTFPFHLMDRNVDDLAAGKPAVLS